jgi:hypothetical protein
MFYSCETSFTANRCESSFTILKELVFLVWKSSSRIFSYVSIRTYIVKLDDPSLIQKVLSNPVEVGVPRSIVLKS